MSENTNENGTLLQKAVKEMNENDDKGAVSKIKGLIKMINSNDEKIALYVKSNADLKKQISKLVAKGPLTEGNFVPSQS